MKTEKKGRLGCLLLALSFVMFSVGIVLMLGSSHPAPGTPVRTGQFTFGGVLTLLGMVGFPVGAFFGLTAGLEWLVYGRRRSLRSVDAPTEAIAAPSPGVSTTEEGDEEHQTVR